MSLRGGMGLTLRTPEERTGDLWGLRTASIFVRMGGRQYCSTSGIGIDIARLLACTASQRSVQAPTLKHRKDCMQVMPKRARVWNPTSSLHTTQKEADDITVCNEFHFVFIGHLWVKISKQRNVERPTFQGLQGPANRDTEHGQYIACE